MPVDLYVGGAEHAVLHLMYARFWHKVLYDLGHVSTQEPFMKLRHQGIILGEDSRKMSKSRGNVVNPDDIVEGVRGGRHAAVRNVHGSAGGDEALEHPRRGRGVTGSSTASGGSSSPTTARLDPLLAWSSRCRRTSSGSTTRPSGKWGRISKRSGSTRPSRR